jgi:hypothetical protein
MLSHAANPHLWLYPVLKVEIKEDFDEGGGKLDATEMVQFFTEAMLLLKVNVQTAFHYFCISLLL